MVNKKRQNTQLSKGALFTIVGACIVAVLTVMVIIKENGGGSSKKTTTVTESVVANNETTQAETTQPETTPAKPSAEAQAIVEKMSLDQKIAQMFMVAPDDFMGIDGVSAAGDTTKAQILQYPVGGYIHFSQNIIDQNQLTQMNKNLQTYSNEAVGLPMFIAVDEEGGTVTRIAGNSAFGVQDVGNMIDIGNTKDSSKAYDTGKYIGGYLCKLGFNVDFAPDADVYTNQANEVVKLRSFGSDANVVSDMVLQEMKGLTEENVLPAIKHFPGHGATATDSHEGYALVDKTYDEIKENELKPFADAAKSGVPFVMVGHLSAPKITGDDLPATLSKKMITDILRNDLGYDGIVITDSMKMGAITEKYNSDKAAVMAVQAGADMILMPGDFYAAYNGIKTAVSNGEITEERINESVVRIVTEKLAMGNNEVGEE